MSACPSLSLLLITLPIIIQLTNGETIHRNTISDTSNVTCNSFPCIIYCNVESSCRSTNISCPSSSSENDTCTIYLDGEYAAYESVINIGTSSVLNINARGRESMKKSIIEGYWKIGSKINLDVTGDDGAQYVTIYSSYGEESELNIICGYNGAYDYCCRNMKIYDDYSTTVDIRSYSQLGFYQTEVKNIFNYNHFHGLNITKNTSIINPNYRGSVTLYAAISAATSSFEEFLYEGIDHGTWSIVSDAGHGFSDAVIYADHSFITNESYNISVSGHASIAIGTLILYASQNNAYISLTSNFDHAFYYAPANSFRLLCDKHPSLFVIDTLEMSSNSGTGPFIYNFVNISNDIKNVIINGDGTQNSFSDITLIFGGIILNNAFFNVYDDIDSLSFATININRVNGDIGFIKHKGRGQGFVGINIIISNGIGGNALFISNSTLDGRDFQSALVTINEIGGNLEMYDYSHSLYGYIFSVMNINIDGIKGDAYFRGNSVSGGESFTQTTFNIKRVDGDMEFTENSVYGRSFINSKYYIDYIGGNLLYHAKYDNGRQAFDQSMFNIGTIRGNVSFIGNTYGAFSDSQVNINRIDGIAQFIGTAKYGTGGHEFYSTDFNISNCPIIIFETNYVNSFHESHNYFGSNVGIVDVIINGGDNVLLSSKWDCRECDEFILQCLNDANCGGPLDIYCPINNLNNKCKVYCSQNAECDDIDIFTTNGYCKDFEFICLDSSNNSIASCSTDLSRVICTRNTSNKYGVLSSNYCNIQQTSNDEWICKEWLTSKCNNICIDTPITTLITDSPSNTPTTMPTANPSKTILISTTTEKTDDFKIIVATDNFDKLDVDEIIETAINSLKGNNTNINIISTEVVDNSVIILFTVPSGTDLDKDIVEKQIKGSLENQYDQNFDVSVEEQNNTKEKPQNNDNLYIVILIVSILILIICIVMMVIFISVLRKKHKQKKTTLNEKQSMTEDIGNTTDFIGVENVGIEKKEDKSIELTNFVDTNTRKESIVDDGDIDTEEMYEQPLSVETAGNDSTPNGNIHDNDNRKKSESEQLYVVSAISTSAGIDV